MQRRIVRAQLMTDGSRVPLVESLRAFFQRIAVKRASAAMVGAIAGFAYYHYVGCSSGTCPITGNPYISTMYGAAVGFLLVPSRKAELPSKPLDPTGQP